MGEQRNLTEENVAELKAKLEKMQKKNPDLEFRFFEQNDPILHTPMGQKPDRDTKEESILELAEKVEALERKIDHIFDGHVLMNGQFKKLL